MPMLGLVVRHLLDWCRKCCYVDFELPVDDCSLETECPHSRLVDLAII